MWRCLKSAGYHDLAILYRETETCDVLYEISSFDLCYALFTLQKVHTHGLSNSITKPRKGVI